MGRLTEPAAMPLPGRADPRPGHLHRQHREAVSPSDEHRLRWPGPARPAIPRCEKKV